jgi:uncharacterized protein
MLVINYSHSIVKVLAYVALLVCFSALADGEIRFPLKPAEGKFVVDEANLLSAISANELGPKLSEVLRETAIPIIFVSIQSQKAYGAENMPIETYARLLYDQWGIGHERITVEGRGVGRSVDIPWNKGILFLVAVDDRKARIELGGGFLQQKNTTCRSIMSDHIIPFFRRGDYQGGILNGIQALSQMAKGETVEPPPRPWWHYGLMVLLVVLAIFTIVSLIRRGSSGWAWMFWAAVFAIMVWLFFFFLDPDDGFDGGSYGGGSSGGGGASGSW